MVKRLVLGAVLACALAGASYALAAAPKKLSGTVGPGFTISLKSSTGQKVSTLTHGSYVFAVQDKSGIHNFVLKGPGVNKEITGVGFSGSKTSPAITLKAGKYEVLCTVHGFSQKFTVK
jgi:opacity protein-like surface antigen